VEKYVAVFAAGERANAELALSAWRAAERAVVHFRGSLEELVAAVRDRISYCNRVRRHSSLGDRPPLEIIEDFYREG